jgi:RNA polymerase sigma-70 factor (ECF subfamily)
MDQLGGLIAPQDASYTSAGRRVEASGAIPSPLDPQPDDGASGERGSEPPRLTPLRELQLIEAHRMGDPRAMADLLRAYQRRVYAVCYRMVRNADEAADLTQDALVKIMEGLDSYDQRSAFSTWVIRVTMNCCLSYLRRKKVRRHGSLDEPAGGMTVPRAAQIPAEGELPASKHVEQAELREVLLAAMRTLEPQARAILVLRDLQELDYQQITEVMDIPIGTVKSRLFRARAALREAAERRLGDSDRGEEPA